MTVVGTALAAAAVSAYWRRSQKFAGWRKATGTIVAITTETVAGQDSGLYSIHHSTTVRFRDHRGGEFTVEDLSYTHQDHVGRNVPILYDPANPADLTISDWRLYAVEWSVLTLALICFLAAA